MSNQEKTTKGGKTSPQDAGKHSPRIANRRALFDYHILEKTEAGIELVGSEVKSVRNGHVQLAQSFARIRNGQVYMYACHIDEYVQANQLNHDPTRTRRLLLHAREIRKLELKLKKEPGTTLVPLEIYFKRGYAKVALALAKGKGAHDKRAAIKERDDKRNMQRAMRRR
jgi:SsrA-binding protein